MISHQEYERDTLDEDDLDTDPIKQFGTWLDTAVKSSEIDEPYAMTVATSTASGMPSARIVLLRSFDERGFVFYTNYDSQKGSQIEANPFAALVFYWDRLQRQVRIEGNVECVDAAESDEYFAARPWRSQLGALASNQSESVAARSELEARMEKLQSQYPEGSNVPRPAHWGGYRVIPNSIEFWQGRRSRLHDRLSYTQSDDGWVVERLEP